MSLATRCSLEVEPVAGAVGAILRGISLDEPPAADVVADIENVLAQFGVVFSTGQGLDTDGHAALAVALGRPRVPGAEHLDTVRPCVQRSGGSPGGCLVGD